MDNELRKQYVITKHKKDIFEIADEIYGNAGMAVKILRENPGVYELKAGMVLNLPNDEPQKPATTDQAIRLDFAGLKDYHRAETAPDLESDSKGGPPVQKEQVARELFGLLKESGLLNPAAEPVQHVKEAVGSPEENEEEEPIEESSDDLEEQIIPEIQEDVCSSVNPQENGDGFADSECENQTEERG